MRARLSDILASGGSIAFGVVTGLLVAFWSFLPSAFLVLVNEWWGWAMGVFFLTQVAPLAHTARRGPSGGHFDYWSSWIGFSLVVLGAVGHVVFNGFVLPKLPAVWHLWSESFLMVIGDVMLMYAHEKLIAQIPAHGGGGHHP